MHQEVVSAPFPLHSGTFRHLSVSPEWFDHHVTHRLNVLHNHNNIQIYFSTQNVYLRQPNWLILRTSIEVILASRNKLFEIFSKEKKHNFLPFSYQMHSFGQQTLHITFSICLKVALKCNVLSSWMFIPCSVRTCLGTCTTELIVASSAFTLTNVAFASFMLALIMKMALLLYKEKLF